MERQEYKADFTTLKSAYLEVKSFLENEGWEKVRSLSTTIENDLGLSGDDNYELLVKFTERYNLGYDNFDYSAHFLSEGELFDSTTFTIQLLLLPLYIIKLISFGKINLLPSSDYWHRETLDLTFGDMVVWHLVKDFKHHSEMNIMLSR